MTRPSKNITLRELEILKHLCEGSTSKQIGLRCGISYSTVESHKKQLMNKLGAVNAAELVELAYKAGLV